MSSISRFLLAGRGLSIRTGKYLVQTLFVGAFAGLVVVAFRCMINLGDVWISDGVCGLGRIARFAMPAVGAFLGYLLIRRFDSLEHARGTDSAILAYHRRHGYKNKG